MSRRAIEKFAEEYVKKKKEPFFKNILYFVPFLGNLLLKKRLREIEKENIELKITLAYDSIGSGMISDMDIKKTSEAIVKDAIQKIKCDTIRLLRVIRSKNAEYIKGEVGIDKYGNFLECKGYPSRIDPSSGKVSPLVIQNKCIIHFIAPELFSLKIKESGEIKREKFLVSEEVLKRINRKASRYKVWEKVEVPILDGEKVIGVLVADNSETKVPFSDSKIFVLARAAKMASVQLKNAELFEEKAKEAIHDSLTSLYNRRYFEEELRKEILRALRYKRPLSLALLDLDNFKQINDTYGHSVGDMILKDMAEKLIACTRNIDIVARYGGEEFAIIFPETSAENAFLACEKIRKIVESSSFGIKNENKEEKISLTISAGIAELKNKEGDIFDELIRNADAALYAAKKEGRNKVKIFEA